MSNKQIRALGLQFSFNIQIKKHSKLLSVYLQGGKKRVKKRNASSEALQSLREIAEFNREVK